MSNRTLLTQDGFDKLVEELKNLKNKQTHLVKEIEEVAQPDESGEDGLATQLKEELEVVNSKIDGYEEALEMSEIISGTPLQKGVVQIGSVVKVKISGKSENEFSIVSHIESDPSQKKISDQSPLGKALVGRKVNDEIEVDAPIGKITYKIISVN